MSKKNKKSRFTKSDVNAICLLQRKIDAYESYLWAINSMLHSSGDKILPIILMNTDMDMIASDSYKIARKLRSEANAGNNLLSESEKIEWNPTWSEEDYNEIETIACHLDNIGNEGMAEVLRNIRDKYHPTWKPSEEQMRILSLYADQNNIHGTILTSLHQDLKKLKG